MEDERTPEDDGDTVRGLGIWEHFTVQDGLPDMKIECIAEDRAGYIWIGTHDRGVTRYDGQEFVTYTRSDGLAGDGVFSVLQDRAGHMWFGTNRGLTRHDGEHFETIATPEPCGFLWGSCIDHDGNLWFGMDRRPGRPAAVVRWDGARAEVVEADHATGKGASINCIQMQTNKLVLAGDGVYTMGLDSDTPSLEHVAETPYGVSATFLSIDRDSSTPQVTVGIGPWLNKLTADGSLICFHEADATVVSVARGRAGALYYATASGNVVCLQGTRTKLVAEIEALLWNGMLFDSRQRLWIGSYGMGVYRYDDTIFRTLTTKTSSLPSNRITRLCSDDKGQLWIGTSAGLLIVSRSEIRTMLLEESSRQQPITSACCDAAGHVWIGTRRGVVYEVVDGSVTKYTIVDSVGYTINEVVANGRGRTYYLARIPRCVGYLSDGTSTPIALATAEAGGVAVGAICTNDLGELVYSFERQSGECGVAVHRATGDIILCVGVPCLPTSLHYDGEGNLWMGSQSGLHVLRPESKSALPCEPWSFGVIACIRSDDERCLWIGTEGGGVVRYDQEVFQRIVLPGDPGLSVISDVCLTAERGVAWFGTERGLVAFSRATAVPQVEILRVISGEDHDKGLTVFLRGTSKKWQSRDLLLRYRWASNQMWQYSWDTCLTVPPLPPGSQRVAVEVIDPDLVRSPTRYADVVISESARDMGYQAALKGASGVCELVGISRLVSQLRVRAAQVARSELSVLITGETGTGKGVLARLIHELSRRKDGPFIQVNCSALHGQLVDSELFGHQKGAFTGAVTSRAGRFELANGGTIFLDEIGDLPVECQGRLLHVLQEGTVCRVGAERPIGIDARVIAATNHEMERAIASGTFREDLYFRLNVFDVEVPPLRNRPEDIESLARHFMEEAARVMHRHVPALETSALNALQAYKWPGNVRELEHIIQRAMLLCGASMGVADLSVRTSHGARHMSSGMAAARSDLPTLNDLERDYVQHVLRQTNGVICGPAGAAVILGLHPNTLRSRMEKLGLHVRHKRRRLHVMS